MTEKIYCMTLRSSADACNSNRTSMIAMTLTVHQRNIRVSYLKAIVNPKQSPYLETFISILESSKASHKPSKPKHDNLMKSERCALYDFQNRQEIIIKPADKGSAVVVMDRDHYISEAGRQLGDSTYYRLLDHDPTPEFAKEMSEGISEMHDEGHISMKNRDYLLVEHPTGGRFDFLPKIFKADTLGRPIVSANGHPTEKISGFVDLHLQPHIQNLPSYLKDTTDCLRRQDAQAPFQTDTLLVSMDLTSLYINIPHQDGIQACEDVWEERKVKDP